MCGFLDNIIVLEPGLALAVLNRADSCVVTFSLFMHPATQLQAPLFMGQLELTQEISESTQGGPGLIAWGIQLVNVGLVTGAAGCGIHAG